MATRSLLPLREQDFSGITLSESCPYSNIVVLFYNNEKESQQLYELLASTVNSVVGDQIVAALNIVDNPVFMRNASMPSGADPYRSFRLREIPHILTYRNKEPVAHYNGKLTSEMLANYILLLASDPSYYEPISVTAGTTVDNNLELPGKKPYLNTKDSPNRVARNSFELEDDIRGYDTKPGAVQKGSTAEAQGLQTLQSDANQESSSIPSTNSSSTNSSSTPATASAPVLPTSAVPEKRPPSAPTTPAAPGATSAPAPEKRTPSVASVLPPTNVGPSPK
jgi:hypothetical protein